MFKYYLHLLILILSTFSLQAQDEFEYSVELTPVIIPGLPGVHSYAFGQHEGKWLILGGRLDGIHARQPFNAFPASQNNNEIFVIDAASQQFWTAPLAVLPTGIAEQLQSTNMNFYQDSDTLYIIGGYSFSASANDHITHDKMTSILVSATIDAVINGSSYTDYFKQITDPIFANTGGQMGKIGTFFYLIGGQRFDGRYNPMNNPTFTQTYHTMVQKFKINNSGQLSFSDYSSVSDPIHLRRRDYNLLPQRFPDGTEGYMISSGVFQQDTDLPFLYPVYITENGYTAVTEFNQYLSNYHSATASLYSVSNTTAHNLFFGGISQYYYENGQLIQDDLVPFVKTISRVSRSSDGTLTEFKLPVEMPGLKGAGAEFIPAESAPYSEKEILLIDQLTEDETVIGHIYGGIESSSLNPFSENSVNQTQADPIIYAVTLIKTPDLGTEEIHGNNPFSMSVFPNPVKDQFKVEIDLQYATSARYFIYTMEGQMIQEGQFDQSKNGLHTETIKLKRTKNNQTVNFVVVVDGKYFLSEKIVLH